MDVLIASSNSEKEGLFSLALDTGASTTTISWDIMDYLGYEPAKSRRTGRLITGSGVEYAPIVNVQKISLGGESIENIDVYCHNFPEESYVDGVIGLNFLKYFNFFVSYDKGEVELQRRENM